MDVSVRESIQYRTNYLDYALCALEEYKEEVNRTDYNAALDSLKECIDALREVCNDDDDDGFR